MYCFKHIDHDCKKHLICTLLTPFELQSQGMTTRTHRSKVFHVLTVMPINDDQ